MMVRCANKVVQIRFVHDDHAGMPEGGLVDEIVVRIIAEMVQRDIEERWIERFFGGREDLTSACFAISATSAAE